MVNVDEKTHDDTLFLSIITSLYVSLITNDVRFEVQTRHSIDEPMAVHKSCLFDRLTPWLTSTRLSIFTCCNAMSSLVSFSGD